MYPQTPLEVLESGFGALYYNKNKEPQNPILVIKDPTLTSTLNPKPETPWTLNPTLPKP